MNDCKDGTDEVQTQEDREKARYHLNRLFEWQHEYNETKEMTEKLQKLHLRRVMPVTEEKILFRKPVKENNKDSSAWPRVPRPRSKPLSSITTKEEKVDTGLLMRTLPFKFSGLTVDESKIVSRQLDMMPNIFDVFKWDVIPESAFELMLPDVNQVRLVKPYTLFDYQMAAANWMISREATTSTTSTHCAGSWFLAMEMGLGKTLCAAYVTCHSLVQQRALRQATLYVTPHNLFGTAVRDMIKFFGYQLRILVWHRNQLKSAFDLVTPEVMRSYDVVITSYAAIQADAKKNRILANIPWYRIVLDESQWIRNSKTLRHQAVRELNATHRGCMTGSPIFNSMADIFHQLEFLGLDTKTTKQKTKTTFRNMELFDVVRFVSNDMAAASIQLPPLKEHIITFELNQAERDLHHLLSHQSYTILSERNKLQLAPSQVRQKMSELRSCLFYLLQVCSAPYLLIATSEKKKQEQERKQQAKRKKALHLNDEIEEEETDEKSGSIESGYMTNEPKIIQYHPEWASFLQDRAGASGCKSSKLICVQQFIAEKLPNVHPGEKVVVFALWVGLLELFVDSMCQVIPDFAKSVVIIDGSVPVVKRDSLLEKFQYTPEIKYLCMTLQTGGIGLNIQQASVVVFLQSWFTYETEAQGIARCHRIGQTRDVHIYRFLPCQGWERDMYEFAQKKRQMSEGLKKSAPSSSSSSSSLSSTSSSSSSSSASSTNQLPEGVGGSGAVTNLTDAPILKLLQDNLDIFNRST